MIKLIFETSFFAEAYPIVVGTTWPRTWTTRCSAWWTPPAGRHQSYLHRGLHFWDKSSSTWCDVVSWQFDLVLKNGNYLIMPQIITTEEVHSKLNSYRPRQPNVQIQSWNFGHSNCIRSSEMSKKIDLSTFVRLKFSNVLTNFGLSRQLKMVFSTNSNEKLWEPIGHQF